MKIEIEKLLSDIAEAEAIATGREIRELARLKRVYVGK